MTASVSEMIETQLVSMARELVALDAVSERAIAAERASKKYDVKLGSNVAWIAERRANVLAELRQCEKHERHMVRTPEQRQQLVLEYVRQAGPVHLAEIAAVVRERELGRSVLA